VSKLSVGEFNLPENVTDFDDGRRIREIDPDDFRAVDVAGREVLGDVEERRPAAAATTAPTATENVERQNRA